MTETTTPKTRISRKYVLETNFRLALQDLLTGTYGLPESVGEAILGALTVGYQAHTTAGLEDACSRLFDHEFEAHEFAVWARGAGQDVESRTKQINGKPTRLAVKALQQVRTSNRVVAKDVGGNGPWLRLHMAPAGWALAETTCD